MDVDAGELPDALPDFTDAELEPVIAVNGIPNPLPGVYFDMGAADPNAEFRSLMAFPMREKAILEEAVMHMYDPGHPNFRNYMSPSQWMANHGPPATDVQLVKLWLESQGFQVPFVATNLMLVEFTGTVGQFNSVFQTTLHVFERDNPQVGNPPIDVYGTLDNEPLMIPLWVAQKVGGVITCDLAAEKGTLTPEAGGIVSTPPNNLSQNDSTPAKIAKAYAVDQLHAMGYRGQGVKLGVTIGALFRFKDAQSFWTSYGIARNDPTVIQTMEPIVTRYIESTLDVQWSGAMAPLADMLVYAGPDSRNTSMVYTFNEAIGQNQVNVITNSFAHREDSEPAPVRIQYNDSALVAAAYGITVMAASGDSAGADTPSVSPWVTAVGGTRLYWNSSQTSVTNETAWPSSGCGDSLSFLMPEWQMPYVTNVEIPGRRATSDVGLNASTAAPYWIYYVGNWARYGGTSFASPVFGGLMASVNSYRLANGLPPVGWFNSTLYTNAAVKQAFKDITTSGPAGKYAKVGWDYPTGWGSPNAVGLALAIP